MPMIIRLLLNTLTHLSPGFSVVMVPFLVMTVYSLGGTIYTTHKVMRRSVTGETIVGLVVPYLLMGAFFILEYLMISSLFIDADILRRTGIAEMLLGSAGIYVEILGAIVIFGFSATLYARESEKENPDDWGESLLWIAVRNAGWEVIVSIALVAFCVVALLNMEVPTILQKDFPLRVFAYGIFTVMLKTAIHFLLVLYTRLFKRNDVQHPALDEDFDGWYNYRRIRGHVRRKAGYMMSLFGLFSFMFALAVFRPVGLSLWWANMAFFWLVLYFGYQLVIFLFPDMTVLRRIFRWGEGTEIAALLCKEFFDEEPIIRQDQYTFTRHFIIDEANFTVRIYYLPLFLEQIDRKLLFADGSNCQLRKSMEQLDAAVYVEMYADATTENEGEEEGNASGKTL